MKICFIVAQNESLGIEYLASFLKNNGHQVDLLFDPCLFNDSVVNHKWPARLFDRKKHILAALEKMRPDCVGIQVFADTANWAIALTKLIKTQYPDIKIILGGIHPTSVPETLLTVESVDYLIRGEGEHALLELLQCLEQKQDVRTLKNLCFRDENGKAVINPLRPLIDNLDTLPFPDKGLFYSNGFPTTGYKIMTARGCPFNCTYCYNHLIKRIYDKQKGFVRRRSVANVMEELVLAKETFKANRIFFDDDVFVSDLRWLERFSVVYAEKIRLPNFCFVHPSYVNADVMFLLKQMNTQLIEIGVQSIDESYRENVYHRYYPQAQLETALTLIKKANIPCLADNIINYNDIDVADALDIVEFYNRYRVAKVYLFNLRVFPKTEISRILGEENSGKVGEENNYFSVSRTKELKMVQKVFMLLLLSKLMSPKFIQVLIKKKWYRYLPLVNYHFVLELFYALEIKIRRKTLFNRETTSKYVRYIAKKWLGDF